MELQVGKGYRVKNDILNFKKGGVWLLVDEGYQTYYGEQNFVPINMEESCRYIVLRNSSDEDMGIRCHLDRYFEETE